MLPATRQESCAQNCGRHGFQPSQLKRSAQQQVEEQLPPDPPVGPTDASEKLPWIDERRDHGKSQILGLGSSDSAAKTTAAAHSRRVGAAALLAEGVVRAELYHSDTCLRLRNRSAFRRWSRTIATRETLSGTACQNPYCGSGNPTIRFSLPRAAVAPAITLGSGSDNVTLLYVFNQKAGSSTMIKVDVFNQQATRLPVVCQAMRNKSPAGAGCHSACEDESPIGHRSCRGEQCRWSRSTAR